MSDREQIMVCGNGRYTYIYMGILCTVFIILLTALPLYADIYMYVDKEGNYYFTDTPASSQYRLFFKEKRRNPRVSYSTNRYDKHIREASKMYGIPFSLLKAMMKAESDFNPRAVSRKGAKGLMQIMPENFRALQITNPFDPRENIMGGARYMKQLLNRFNGELRLAIAAYNVGPDNVSNARGIPRIKETENYVRKVMRYYRDLKNVR